MKTSRTLSLILFHSSHNGGQTQTPFCEIIAERTQQLDYVK
jgi:hypothetical protein